MDLPRQKSSSKKSMELNIYIACLGWILFSEESNFICFNKIHKHNLIILFRNDHFALIYFYKLLRSQMHFKLSSLLLTITQWE